MAPNTSGLVPHAIADSRDRPTFNPDDPYWADVPLVTHHGLGDLTVIRGDLDDTDLANIRLHTKALNLKGTLGYLKNPHQPRSFGLAAFGYRTLDYRACFWDDFEHDNVRSGPANPEHYLRVARARTRLLKTAFNDGYVPLGYDPSGARVLLGRPAPGTDPAFISLSL